MSKVLGIDAGTNSVGWSIRDTDAAGNQIVDYGVITFDKGVASEKGNEFPKVQKRTESRSKRRNYQAEKYRKWELLKFLIEKEMCPLTIEELNEWRKYTKGKERGYPGSEQFISWLRFDFDGDGRPDFHLLGKDKRESYFIFRTLAIDEDYKKIFDRNPHILGRVFYQLVQRRGFRGRDEEEAKTMLKGSEKTGTRGRDEIADYITKYRSLGSALYHFQKQNGGRIRQRYNLRKDYEAELKLICELHEINEEDYKRLWKAIIWQRPLRTQKGLIGNCIYEKNKKRAPISHPLYEEYRTWIFINNLNIKPPFDEDRKTYLSEKIYPLFYRAANDFELSTILKQLRKDGARMESKFSDKTKVISARLLNAFSDILGENWKTQYEWNNIHYRDAQPKKKIASTYDFEDVWHVLHTFNGQENLYKFAVEKLNVDEESAARFSKIKLNQGYATLSISAIKKILPYLRNGFLYSQAVYLANLNKVLGKEGISEELIADFTVEVGEIIKRNKEEKTLNEVVNGLIQNELSDEYRYNIEIDRELDKSELKRISDKIVEVIGQITWSSYSEDKRRRTLDYVSNHFLAFLKKSVLSKRNVFLEQPRLHDQIFDYIQRRFDVPKENIKYLWHPSEQESYKSAMEYQQLTLGKKDIYISAEYVESFMKEHPEAQHQGRYVKLLGNPEPLSKGFKNPMALKTLHRIKKLINYLLQTGKIDDDTRVVIEIARELNDANKRRALENWNREREKENEAFRDIIREINKECGTTFNENDRNLIRKIRLWKEQGKQCLYTGRSIGLCDVLDGAQFNIEHTIAASTSFDNELKNLTLADSDFNRNIKKKLFPTQLPNYEEIKPRLLFMEDKVEHLEKLFKEWKNKAGFASTKSYKDYCIQNYHLVKIDLDYWRAKLKSFTLEEYKASWKNSQLRDTQIVTKYALPFLKTVFRKVSVEKGTVVNAFKEIYEVKLEHQKKNRNVHSHHAQDAAVLTLIPPFFERDKILQKYNDAKDINSNNVYHEKPKDWDGFKSSYILDIENEILINNLAENKTTLDTYKTVRKRGKIVWLNQQKGIRKIAKGDTVRGQLHGESLYGAIKLPLRNGENQIQFDKNSKMILIEEPLLVIRKELLYKKDANSPGFKTLDEIDRAIVDRALFDIIKKQVEKSTDFKTALTDGIYMLDKHGKKVNRIRRIRCKESLKYNTAVKVHTHTFTSDKEYKHFTLAKNGENALCLFYKNDVSKAINIQSIGQVAESKIKNDQQYFAEPYYNIIENGRGKSKTNIPLYAVLRTGCKVLFYKESLEELKIISNKELAQRMFKIYQFESDGRIKFRHHLAAGIDTELKKENPEYSSFDMEKNQVFLRLTQSQWNFAIDGKDFQMNLDGTVKFNF